MNIKPENVLINNENIRCFNIYPENILINKDNIKLIDYGIKLFAKWLNNK